MSLAGIAQDTGGEGPRYEWEEAVFATDFVRVCRNRHIANGQPVILKILTPNAPETLRVRFRREYQLLSQIHCSGVIRPLRFEMDENRSMMVLEDIGGESLDRLFEGKAFPLGQFLELAVGLAATLGHLHQSRIVHKAICPAHIVLNPETGKFVLVGFGQADELPQWTLAPQPPSTLEGNLAYLSPEQTGRMNRAVDYRSDLYSLGVTFYELLTGKQPFQAEDPLGLIHCHIAANPEPVEKCNPAIPKALSRIVRKLMAKMAEDRYQSARGLHADLERCRRSLNEQGAIPDFHPGQNDYDDQLRVPQKLYGREKEVCQLLKTFERIREGGRELLLVAGYSGVGKTSLVQEVHRPILEARGYFLEGKFDQLQRNVPYFAWIQAFTGMVHSLLMESERQLALWKERILEAVGNIGGALTQVIPGLELIIGAQSQVPTLGPTEAQNRLNYVFVKLMRTLATREHPLVVFLDDLQWIDAASLNLLQMLLSSSAVSRLLVIGAYRENEVDVLHPLHLLLERLRNEPGCIGQMALKGLPEEIVNGLIAETLHVLPGETRFLAQLIHAKTGGNPFFLLQTLKTLQEKGAIFFDPEKYCWKWNIALLKQTEITDNVVSLMLGKIQQLPAETQQLLPLAACMGYRFDLGKMGIIAGQSEDAALDHLQPALREGLVVPIEGGFQFAHDRIQQAAYCLIPDAQQEQVHLEIGRILLGHMPEGDHDEQLFTVVDHLNIGARLLQAREERLNLAQLNLRAGTKARASAAFSAAASYLEAGIKMLDGESWQRDYDLALELHTRGAEAASLMGDFRRTNELFSLVKLHAKSAVDKLGVYESKTHGCISQGNLQEALDTTLELLDQLGLHLPGSPTAEDVDQAMQEAKALYAGIPIESLLDLPAMNDQRKLSAVHLISKINAAACYRRPNLHLLVVFSEVILSIRYGNAIESPYFYAAYALILCGLLREFEAGYRFAKLALELMQANDSPQLRSKTLSVVSGHVWHFREHLRTTLPLLEKGFQSGLETGDFEYCGYTGFFYCCNSFFAGVDLPRLERSMDAYGEALIRLHVATGHRMLAPYWQAVKNLRNPEGDPCRLAGDCFDEETMLPIYSQTQHRGGLCAYHVSRMMLCYLFSQYEQGLESAERAEENKDGMMGMFSQSVATFFDSLIRLRLCRNRAPEEQARLLKRVDSNLRELEKLAGSAPMNQLHKFYLVEAECMRQAGGSLAVLEIYDKAISLAEKNQYLHEEALANELAAEFCWEKGKEEFAQLYLRRAYQGYQSWGALAKLRHLEQRYSSLLELRRAEKRSDRVTSEMLDLSTVMKATAAISSEMDLNRLMDKVLRIAIENVGAQTGFLLMERGGQWQIAARGEASRGQPEPATKELVAMSAVWFVARTRELLVLGNAANTGAFINDPHIRSEGIKSLLCAPLLNQGRLGGILYFENNLTTHAFIPERLAVLELLAAQAAISLENALVYQALRESEAKYRRIIDTANEGVWVLGPDARTAFVNARMAQMIGYSPEEMEGRVLPDFMFEEDSADHLKKMENRRHGTREVYERRFRHRNGKTVWTLASATPIFDNEHRFQGSFAMLTDITGHKKALEEIHRLNQDLEERVRERTLELEATNKELESFSYSVSHDLRAPLRTIEGFSRLLMEHHRGQLNEEGREYLDRVCATSKRMAQLIEGMLQLSRLSRSEIHLSHLNLSALVRTLADEMREIEPGRHVDFIIQPGLVAEADPVLVRSVFENLLGNAWKFTSKLASAKIEFGQCSQQNVFFVRDNGAGFDMQYADKLFSAFQRLHSLKDFPGSGIGLSTVQRIIHKHGGRIWAESEPGKGATFYFSLGSN